MGSISLAEVEIIKQSRFIPLISSLWEDRGITISEPWFDYNDDGEIQDFGLDLEPPDPGLEDLTEVDLSHLVYNVSPSEFTETAVRIPEAGRVNDFSFHGREYLRRIYDTPSQRVLLKCGRQVEKCELEVVKVLTADGRLVKASDMKVGDKVISLEVLNPETEKYGLHLGDDPRKIGTNWKSVVDEAVELHSVGEKYALRIITRMGSECEVSEETPLLEAAGWRCAGDLQVGMRVASLRAMPEGQFGGGSSRPLSLIQLYGYAIADGGLMGWVPSITKKNPMVRDRIRCCFDLLEGRHELTKSGEAFYIKKDFRLYAALVEDGLMGKASGEKFIPDWVFSELTQEETVAFIKALWCDCDGSVKQSTPSQWNIVYASTSRRLAEQVRALLLKFGIPSRIRRNNHPFYRDDPDPDVDQHLVRVETIEGVHKFLRLFTDIDPGPVVYGDSNRDTYPLEIVQPLVYTLCKDLGLGKREGRGKTSPLKEAGLRPTLKYPPSRAKLHAYVSFFEAWGADDHPALIELRHILDGDIIWDEIVEIDDLGMQEVFHLETKVHHNYVAENLVLHNSTTLGNKLMGYACLNNNFKCLFVAPSAEQAKVFSNDRVKDVIDNSPLLRVYTNTKLNQNVFFKKLINFSQIRLRYAYLTADRVRGIPADLIEIDEIQDILIDNIPVIEQCAFHSPYKLFVYSGTPKSLDNTIEHYWVNFSTQNEWIVPCDRHGTPKNPSSWHWNILTEANIGKKGLVCDKCGEPISSSHPLAKWAAMNPVLDGNKDKVTFEGYRIPQIMVPWVDWNEVLQHQEQYSRAQFHNEKLGLSYDSGVRPLTKGQLKRCCKPEIRLGDIEHFKRIAVGNQVYCGIDWGCHDEQTRILTKRGFIYFKDLTDEDKVAQWEPETRVMSFVRPSRVVAQKWNKPLIRFKSNSIDMLLTHTHTMRVNPSSKGYWVTESAEETAERKSNIGLVGSVLWRGVEVGTFCLPGLPVSSGYSGCSSIDFRMDDWLEFLGYAVTEGGVCFAKSRKSPEKRRPNCFKLSQREHIHPVVTKKIRDCMDRLGVPYSEFPNPKTGDVNWTICGKQYWKWFYEEVGPSCDTKRLPRWVFDLSQRQLRILWSAMLAGDGYIDQREGNHNGAYRSTSKGLCEDFQELCIRLGLRCRVSLMRKAEGKRKACWVANWSSGRDFHFSTPAHCVERVPYKGTVYCCTVPSGHIVTERNGRIAYQGNSGTESSYTVISFGGYFGTGNFSIFWIHRFTGPDLDPEVQLDKICQMIAQLNVQIVGVDYGGGFHPNAHLTRVFGPQKIMKYQYNPKQKKKIYWEPSLGRFMCHRTEVMNDIFGAIKRKLIDLPNWEDFREPYGTDCLNIFSEFNERLRMIEYKKKPGTTDDAFHSIFYCFYVSMLQHPRPDITARLKDTGLPR